MKIIWYGHSCFRLETGSSVILVDPFLKGNPTFEKAGIAWEEATKDVTHVALTHGHSDHIGGAAAVLRNFKPQELWLGVMPPSAAIENLVAIAQEVGVKVVRHWRPLAAAPDVSSVVTEIGGTAAPIAAIGAAVLLVFVGIKTFKWVRRAM